MRIVITMLHSVMQKREKREKEKERKRESVYVYSLYSRSEGPLCIECSFINISMHAFTLFSEHVKNFLQKREYNANK